MPDFNENNLEKAARQLKTRLMIGRFASHVNKPHAPALRPHTWIFLRQPGDQEDSAICLGIVFKVWAMKKYNMIRFTAHTGTGKEIHASGRLTTLDNGKDGLVLDVRWPWETMLKEYKGLSAGDL
jgi:hypothetical protein